ncbi:hypothetical protein Tco_0916839, partial [Tanacetum coccineum]
VGMHLQIGGLGGKGFNVIKDKNEAMQYTAGAFVQENRWLKGTGASFYLGLKG